MKVLLLTKIYIWILFVSWRKSSELEKLKIGYVLVQKLNLESYLRCVKDFGWRSYLMTLK